MAAEVAVEAWGCVVGVAADAWDTLYTERGEWTAKKETGVSGHVDHAGTFFPGRQLFSKTFQTAQLKAQLRESHPDYESEVAEVDENEEKARFNLQLLCDISAGNKRGLYLTAEYTEGQNIPKYNFPGSAREEYCRFLTKSPTDILLKVLGPSAGGLRGERPGVNIFSAVKETLTTSWANEADKTGFRARFATALGTVESVAHATQAAADAGEQALRDATDAVDKARTEVANVLAELGGDDAVKMINAKLHNTLATKAKLLAEQHAGLIGQLWKGMKLFFQMCVAPETALGLADDLLDLMLTPLVIGKLQEAFAGSKVLTFVTSAKRVMDQLSECKIGQFFFSMASDGGQMPPGGFFAAVIQDIFTIKDMLNNGKIPADPHITAIIGKAEENLGRIFASKVGKDLFQNFVKGKFDGDAGNASKELFDCVLDGIVGSDTAEAAGHVAENLVELKNAFQGKMAKHLMPRIKQALGLPSGLEVKSSIAAKCKFVTEVLVKLLSADNPQAQIGVFKGMWGVLIRHELPLIIEDILNGIPKGKGKHAKPLWPKITLSPDAQIELRKALDHVKEVLGNIIEAMLSVILAIVSPIMKAVGNAKAEAGAADLLSKGEAGASAKVAKLFSEAEAKAAELLSKAEGGADRLVSKAESEAVDNIKARAAEVRDLLSKAEAGAADLLSKGEAGAAELLSKAGAGAADLLSKHQLLSKAEIEAVGLGLQVFQSILKFVQGGSDAMDSAGTLALSIGLKFGVDRKLLEGLLAIFKGTFDASVARDMATALMGNPAASSSGQAATEAICALVGLAQGDWSQLKELAVKMGGFDQEQLEKLTLGIERLKPIINKLKRQMENGKKQLNGRNVEFGVNDDLDPTSLFMKYDVDNSGSLEYNEFFEVLKILNYPSQITEDKVMKIFVAADVSKSESLNMVEFTQAIDMSRIAQSGKVLNLMARRATLLRWF